MILDLIIVALLLFGLIREIINGALKDILRILKVVSIFLALIYLAPLMANLIVSLPGFDYISTKISVGISRNEELSQAVFTSNDQLIYQGRTVTVLRILQEFKMTQTLIKPITAMAEPGMNLSTVLTKISNKYLFTFISAIILILIITLSFYIIKVLFYKKLFVNYPEIKRLDRLAGVFVGFISMFFVICSLIFLFKLIILTGIAPNLEQYIQQSIVTKALYNNEIMNNLAANVPIIGENIAKS